MSRAIATTLGQWHSRLPLSALISTPSGNETRLRVSEPKLSNPRPYLNVWALIQRWLDDLPADSKEEQERNQLLQHELSAQCEEFTDAPGLCGKGCVFIHGDLHDEHVIIREPTLIDDTAESNDLKPERKVDFIDYAYCMPAPPAFELAYHFFEWTGFDCEYQFIPTRTDRPCFIDSYVAAFHKHATDCVGADPANDIAYLECQADRFRGVPGM